MKFPDYESSVPKLWNMWTFVNVKIVTTADDFLMLYCCFCRFSQKKENNVMSPEVNLNVVSHTILSWKNYLRNLKFSFGHCVSYYLFLSPERIEYLCSEKLLLPLALIDAFILGRLFADL